MVVVDSVAGLTGAVMVIAGSAVVGAAVVAAVSVVSLAASLPPHAAMISIDTAVSTAEVVRVDRSRAPMSSSSRRGERRHQGRRSNPSAAFAEAELSELDRSTLVDRPVCGRPGRHGPETFADGDR